MKPFKIKDPLYGYIEIKDPEICDIINSSQFHRLKQIIQTSYTSVYPSATHNRFIHSIGVYYLGTLAIESLKIELEKLNCYKEEELKSYYQIFLLACLLHDVGHSPFSHSGEKYYIKKRTEKGIPCIWEKLLDELKDDEFNIDTRGEIQGAEHEIMSSLLAISHYQEILKKYDKSFFVRCIIGLKYSKNDIRNCFIELLNSNTIDVDKLDYLLRDSLYTGFATVSIDYKRLLSSVCIITDRNNKPSLGFTKAALSTLESVILARDMEKKWIQNHPVIKYESFLIDHMISAVNKYYSDLGIEIFSLEALTPDGIACTTGKFKTNKLSDTDIEVIKKCKQNEPLTETEKIAENNILKEIIDEECSIKLLSDTDIITIAKNCIKDDECVKEYFDRSIRKKALWKSEAEYLLYFKCGIMSEKTLAQLQEKLFSIENEFNTLQSPFINNNLLEYFKKELEKNNKLVFLREDEKKKRADEINKKIQLIQFLKEYSRDCNVDFNFAIISSGQFNTGFTEIEFKNIQIRFDDEHIEPLEKVVQLLDSEKKKNKFFYLYVNCADIKGNKIDLNNFLTELNDFCVRNLLD
ncbi:MAG: HD domain-containing protein [Spirochaetia bacterium]|nr:HD domain-containing protein [Spirochaetia bacterium]